MARAREDFASFVRARWAELTDELVELYEAHVRRHGRGGLVFAVDYDVAPEHRQPLDYSNWVKRVWGPAVRAAELAEPLPTPHDCRHSYGSWLADNGVPPHEIMVTVEEAGVAVSSAELTMLPSATVPVDDSSVAKRVLALMDALDDNDDVQDVYSNFDIADDLLEAIEA